MLQRGGEEALEAHIEKLLAAGSASNVSALGAILKLASNAPAQDELPAAEELLQYVNTEKTDAEVIGALLFGNRDDPAYVAEVVDVMLSCPEAREVTRAKLRG